MGASVKVMLSHDYCHFEVTKLSDQDLTNEQINELRKDVQRLADEAVRQYILAKKNAEKRNSYDKRRHDSEVKRIESKRERGEDLSIEEQATLKLDSDIEWQKQYEPYDYDDEDERNWEMDKVGSTSKGGNPK